MSITAHVSEVKSWSVHMSFRAVDGGIARHTITLSFKPNGETLRFAYLHFISGGQGRESQVTGTTVSIALPYEEFRDWLHILQTESPLTFAWTVDEKKGKVLGVSLFTGDEPPGEGLADADARKEG
jgi:hypothetical protein